MALLRNREVSLIGKADGQDESPTYTVMYKDGERENVRLSELQLTEEEHKNLAKQHGELVVSNVSKIDNKTLQEIRDSQDKRKIEERQAKAPSDRPVPVSKVMVDPTEVANKAPSRPVTPAQAPRQVR